MLNKQVVEKKSATEEGYKYWTYYILQFSKISTTSGIFLAWWINTVKYWLPVTKLERLKVHLSSSAQSNTDMPAINNCPGDPPEHYLPTSQTLERPTPPSHVRTFCFQRQHQHHQFNQEQKKSHTVQQVSELSVSCFPLGERSTDG